jgi:hypothetical protein
MAHWGSWGRVAPHVWILDYTAERLPSSTPPDASSRHVFFGNGCRYIECKENDTEWWYNRGLLDEIEKCAQWRYAECDGPDEFTDDWGITCYCDCNDSPVSERYLGRMHIEVLACELLAEE